MALVDALGDADWQIGITTTTAEYTSAGSARVDPGETGSLVAPPILPGIDAGSELVRQLACETVYWRDSTLANDPTYTPNADGTCPVPVSSEVSREYLTCVCDGGAWNTAEGSGNEEGLEAITDSLCRMGGSVPADCFSMDSPLQASDAESDQGLWREGALARVLVLTDEGDGSRRIDNTDPDISTYLEIWEQFGRDLDVSVIGPTYENGDGSCLDSAQTWAVERYQAVATETGGSYAGLSDLANDCAPQDVAQMAAAAVEGMLQE